MAIEVEQTVSDYRFESGRDQLQQTFVFTGPGASAAAVIEVLFSAPLVGPSSIFGQRPGEEQPTDGPGRVLSGFSPVAGFDFDVSLRPAERSVIVAFSQPDRRRPYLTGDALWTLDDVADGAVLDEQINTAEAARAGAKPLGGSGRSLRRWLFFRFGHQRVMDGATANIARLLG